MRFRLALALVVAALAAPATHAAPPIPSLGEVLDLLPGESFVQDHCVYEVREDGTRGDKVVCAPSGRLPDQNVTVELPRT